MRHPGFFFFALALPFFLALVLLALFVFVLIEINLLGYAYQKIAIHHRHVVTVLLLSLVGSYINIPVTTLPAQHVMSGGEVTYFSVRYVIPFVVDWPQTVVAINVGGVLIPTLLSLYLTEQVPGEDRYNYNLTYLMARLAVMLGGRTAEEIAIGDITTGAESDLAEASSLARRMVTRWGMGKLGLVTFKADRQQSVLGYGLTQGHDYSETTAARIDEEVAEVLKERHEVVHHILTQARAQLDRLAQTLLHEETVDYEALVRVLGPRPTM